MRQAEQVKKLFARFDEKTNVDIGGPGVFSVLCGALRADPCFRVLQDSIA
jgi:hypothetical protein